MIDERIGFVGGGQMAQAWAAALVRSNRVSAARILVHDPSATAIQQFLAQVAGARVTDSNREVVSGSDVVIFAVKPQHVPQVTAELGRIKSSDKLIISIVAGVPLAKLAVAVGSERLIRVMPNTPCLIGQGAAGFALGAGVTERDGQLAEKLLSAAGIAVQVDESLLDAVTGLSGSGPAYVFTIIEALSDGGVRMGLPRATSTALATQTVLGAAALVKTTGEHPAVLRDRVTSPGGTTIAGLQQLEERGLRAALIAAVEAAARRSTELGRQA